MIVTNLLLARLPEQQFVHGGCTINGSLANVLSFEDIHVGLLGVVLPGLKGETHHTRFSGQRLPRPSGPSVN